MGTIKTYNGRNNFLNTYFISIPYYVFLGCSRNRDVSTNTKAFHEEAGSSVGMNQGGLLTPVSPFMKNTPSSAELPDFFTLGPSMLESKGLEQTIVDMGAPLSPFHYQLRKVRVSPVSPILLMTELAGTLPRVTGPRAVPNAYLWMGKPLIFS
jgi:betaine lipid synthase